MIRFCSRYFRSLDYFLLICLCLLLSFSTLRRSYGRNFSWNSLWFSSCWFLRLHLGLLCHTDFFYSFLRIPPCWTLSLALRLSLNFSLGRLFLCLLAHCSFENLWILFRHQRLLLSFALYLSNSLAFNWFASALCCLCSRLFCRFSALGSSSLDLRKLSNAFNVMLSCFLWRREIARRSASFIFAGWGWSCVSIPCFTNDLALNSLFSSLFLLF